MTVTEGREQLAMTKNITKLGEGEGSQRERYDAMVGCLRRVSQASFSPSLIDFQGNPEIRALYQAIGIPTLEYVNGVFQTGFLLFGFGEVGKGGLERVGAGLGKSCGGGWGGVGEGSGRVWISILQKLVKKKKR